MKFIKYIIGFLGVALLFTSCDTTKEESAPISKGKGAVQLLDAKVLDLQFGKLVPSFDLVTDTFTVELRTEQHAEGIDLGKVFEIKGKKIEVVPGNYVLCVHSNNKSVAAFDMPYYAGWSSSFDIKEGELFTIDNVMTQIQNIAVTIDYTTATKNTFSNREVIINTLSNHSLVYSNQTGTDAKIGYFDATDVPLTANVLLLDQVTGKEYTTSFAIDGAKMEYTYTIDVNTTTPEDTQGAVKFNVTISDEMKEIPLTWVVQGEKTVIWSDGFSEMAEDENVVLADLDLDQSTADGPFTVGGYTVYSDFGDVGYNKNTGDVDTNKLSVWLFGQNGAYSSTGENETVPGFYFRSNEAANRDWLISPEIDLTNCSQLEFEYYAVTLFGGDDSNTNIQISLIDATEYNENDIPNLPWVEIENNEEKSSIKTALRFEGDIQAFEGKKVRIAFYSQSTNKDGSFNPDFLDKQYMSRGRHLTSLSIKGYKN
ncbi:DUF4493 domain-containing protein [Flammeovirga kamogawensis]|uniref:DUF4493 domain-containing protein n=1 Tax=Flammeovirga kamogawensis TaxID=373891 RepID=A0ABX8H500_9BACT|nr:DUF4493 domain-containing protein [Flammeovirga kamogawensis]MBB6461874.1 hypothetical protein [Flammeovirga kamogawensis]QWG10512.1 DUF4493 domain-containing protein [Flammeovirga kamogawensis]TRX63621.1 DUF4493 domain-containing protein [Flammeovirga kamogawensis]